jgi:hypothetical protein
MMLERLLRGAVLATTIAVGAVTSGCIMMRPTSEADLEVPAQQIAKEFTTYLKDDDREGAYQYIRRFDERNNTTVSYLRALAYSAHAGKPESGNLVEFAKSGQEFQRVFNGFRYGYGTVTPHSISDPIKWTQDEIPQELFELPIYKQGRKDLQKFIREPHKAPWYGLISENERKTVRSNCVAALCCMALIERDYENCARMLRNGRKIFTSERQEEIAEALGAWHQYLVEKNSYVPMKPDEQALNCALIKDVENLQKAMEPADAEATSK